jgi:hypothetical protein
LVCFLLFPLPRSARMRSVAIFFLFSALPSYSATLSLVTATDLSIFSAFSLSNFADQTPADR